MKATVIILTVLLLVINLGCKKETEQKAPEEAATKFPAPDWKVDETGRYPATMTAVVTLPDGMHGSISENDQLAAFVSEDCRGIASVVKVGSVNVYFLMIRGLADEQSKIIFKYYSAKTGYLFQSGPILNFLVDDVYGTAQNPKVLSVTQVK